jgi:hypothetical protein
MVDTNDPPTVDQQVIHLVRELEEVRRVAIIATTRAEERWSSYLRALELQSTEYERRLEHLNGEARRIAEERILITAQLRREMELGFNVAQKEIVSIREVLTSFIAEQRGLNKGMGFVWTAIVTIATIAIAAMGLWITSKN